MLGAVLLLLLVLLQASLSEGSRSHVALVVRGEMAGRWVVEASAQCFEGGGDVTLIVQAPASLGKAEAERRFFQELLRASPSTNVSRCFVGVVFQEFEIVGGENNDNNVGGVDDGIVTVGRWLETQGFVEGAGFGHWVWVDADRVALGAKMRGSWLRRVLELAKANGPGCKRFWMMGSAPRCLNVFEGERQQFSMNPNALYCVKSKRLREYAEKIRVILQETDENVDFTNVASLSRFVSYDFITSSLRFFQYSDEIIDDRCSDADVSKLQESTSAFFVYRPPEISSTQILLNRACQKLGVPTFSEQALSEELKAQLFDSSTSVQIGLCEKVWLAEKLDSIFRFQEKSEPHWLEAESSIRRQYKRSCTRLLCGDENTGEVPPSLCKKLTEAPPMMPLVLVGDDPIHTSDTKAFLLPVLQDVAVRFHSPLPIFEEEDADKDGFLLDASGTTPARGPLGTCPIFTRTIFHDKHVNDPSMGQVDFVICTFPVSNCEMFMSLHKNLVLYFTGFAPIGLGRWEYDSSSSRDALYLKKQGFFTKYIEDVFFPESPRKLIQRKLKQDMMSQVLWNDWYISLLHISASSKNRDMILVSSQYYAVLLEYLTGIKPHAVVPLWFDYGDFLLLDRSPLVILHLKPHKHSPFSKFGEWKKGILKTLSDQFSNLVIEESIEKISKMKRPRIVISIPAFLQPASALPSEMLKNPLWEVEVLRLFRMQIPVVIPTASLLKKMVLDFPEPMKKLLFGRPNQLPPVKTKPNERKIPTHPHHSNSIGEDLDLELTFWISKFDVYRLPYIHHFDSWDEIQRVVHSVDVARTVEGIRNFNEAEKRSIMDSWEIFMTHRTKESGWKLEMPPANIDHTHAIMLKYPTLFPVLADPKQHPLCDESKQHVMYAFRAWLVVIFSFLLVGLFSIRNSPILANILPKNLFSRLPENELFLSKKE